MKKKNTSYKYDGIFLMGPTASGKTDLAIKLREYLPIEIISVDSALIYRGMNIGTAKPCAKDLKKAPHRLINIKEPNEYYSAANFQKDALKEIKNIINIGRIPLLVGGTMLYFKILLDGLSPLPPTNLVVRTYLKNTLEKIGSLNLYNTLKKIDPITAKNLHPNDIHRVLRAIEVFLISGKTVAESIQNSCKIINSYVYKQFVISPVDRNLLNHRIINRFYKMLDKGLEKEVNVLFERGDLNENMQSMRCVGYRQMWSYLSGNIKYNKMICDGISATRKLAKHQTTWLKKWRNVNWLDSENPTESLKKIIKIIKYN